LRGGIVTLGLGMKFVGSRASNVENPVILLRQDFRNLVFETEGSGSLYRFYQDRAGGSFRNDRKYVLSDVRMSGCNTL
jgi:hypothetical protein